MPELLQEPTSQGHACSFLLHRNFHFSSATYRRHADDCLQGYYIVLTTTMDVSFFFKKKGSVEFQEHYLSSRRICIGQDFLVLLLCILQRRADTTWKKKNESIDSHKKALEEERR